MKLWHNKRDDNEGDLKSYAELMGIRCYEGGPLDLWIPWVLGAFMPVEIKNPKGRNRLQPSQFEFMAECGLNGWGFQIWRTLDDVLATHTRWRALQATIGPRPAIPHAVGEVKAADSPVGGFAI